MRLAGVAGVGLILGSFGAPASMPQVRLVHAAPVVIAGSGYTAGARFAVTFRSGGARYRRRVTVTVAGRFRVVLNGVAYRRCNGYSIAAPGASRHVAPVGSCTTS